MHNRDVVVVVLSLFFLRSIFIARCHARTVVFAVVRLSVTSRYCIETTGRIELVFSTETFPAYLTLCKKEIRVSLK